MKNKIILRYLVGSLSEYEWNKLIRGLSGNKCRRRDLSVLLKSFRSSAGSDARQERASKGVARNFMTDKKRTSRMIAEVFESIFKNDMHEFSNDRFSEVYRERIKLNKSIYLSQLLIRKNLPPDWLNGFISSLIETCDAFEFIGEKIILKRKLIELQLRFNQHSKAELTRGGLVKDTEELHYVTTAECFVNRYLDDLSPDDVSAPGIIDGLVRAVELSADFYSRSRLEHLRYFNYLLAIRLLMARQEFMNAASMLEELNEICDSQALLRYRSNLSRNFRLSALLSFLRRDFRQALGDCVQAGMISSGNLMELNLVRELEALSLIYLAEFDGAVHVLNEMISTGPLGNNELQSAKRHYFLAYALYLTGDSRKTFMVLQHTAAIERHDECWNIGIRLLHIFLDIQAGRFDVADSRIESLRKYIQRTSKSRIYTPRIRIISRLLLKLSFSAYDFPVFLRNHSSGLSVLESDEEGFAWNPGGFEIIPFNRLLESSFDGKKFDQLFASDQSVFTGSLSAKG